MSSLQVEFTLFHLTTPQTLRVLVTVAQTDTPLARPMVAQLASQLPTIITQAGLVNRDTVFLRLLVSPRAPGLVRSAINGRLTLPVNAFGTLVPINPPVYHAILDPGDTANWVVAISGVLVQTHHTSLNITLPPPHPLSEGDLARCATAPNASVIVPPSE